MIEEKPVETSNSVAGIEKCRRSSRISWKRVAEHIARYGGYRFGNATCRKKWDQINDLGSP